MATHSNGRQFSKSKVSNMVRHRGGNYYAVAKVLGKVRRRSLETSDFNLAKERLPAVLEDLRGTETTTTGTVRVALLREADRNDPTIKTSTRHYYQQVAASLLKTADSMPACPADLTLPKLSVAQLRTWFDRHAETASRTRYNGAVALMRRTFKRAVEARELARNPALELKRLVPRSPKPTIPTAADFARIVESIGSQGKRFSKATAATVVFLGSTGLRISEAQALRWRDIDEKALVVRTAKNDILRRVPLTDSAKSVIEELRSVVTQAGADDPVLPVKSPRIAFENACKRLELPHLRVHDLRHMFATRCLEAGVDLSTVAVWLGHLDGGVLAAQVYGHVIEKHSDSQISKVSI